MPPSETSSRSTANERYVGLDLLRIVSAFGIVLLHVYVSAGQPGSLHWLVRLRDFALPAMVMSSFFVLTVSLSRKPQHSFARYLGRRAKRIWLPMALWTVVYSLVGAFVVPPLFGFGSAGLPHFGVFLIGYRHLWYLQFLFIGSILVYPLIVYLAGKCKAAVRPPVRLHTALAASAFLLLNAGKLLQIGDLLAPEIDLSIRMFVEQSVNCLPFIPLGVAAALARDRIGRILAYKFFRPVTAAFVLAAAVLHVATDGIPYTREVFALAVFFAALRPMDNFRTGWIAPLARDSYGVYVLHFLPAQLVWVFASQLGYEFGGGSVLALSAGIYVACLGLTSRVRKAPAADWLLPAVATAGPPKPAAAVTQKLPPSFVAEAA